jgi:hypothetical protein
LGHSTFVRIRSCSVGKLGKERFVMNKTMLATSLAGLWLIRKLGKPKPAYADAK